MLSSYKVILNNSIEYRAAPLTIVLAMLIKLQYNVGNWYTYSCNAWEL